MCSHTLTTCLLRANFRRSMQNIFPRAIIAMTRCVVYRVAQCIFLILGRDILQRVQFRLER